MWAWRLAMGAVLVGTFWGAAVPAAAQHRPATTVQLAARSPVYAQLRNLIDMAVAVAFIQKHGYAERAGWKMATFGDEQALPVGTGAAAAEVAAAVHAAWKGNRFHAVAGGGVSIRAEQALAAERLKADDGGKLARLRQDVDQRSPPDRWWWD